MCEAVPNIFALDQALYLYSVRISCLFMQSSFLLTLFYRGVASPHTRFLLYLRNERICYGKIPDRLGTIFGTSGTWVRTAGGMIAVGRTGTDGAGGGCEAMPDADVESDSV